jgi:hypothetical protein
VPNLSSTSNTVFYLGYGNPAIGTDQSNPAGTWDSNYKAVFHMADNLPTTAIKNSVGANASNVANTSVKTTTGQVDGALAYNGTNDGTSFPIDLSAVHDIMISCWFNWTEFSSDDHVLFEHSVNYNLQKGFIVLPNNATGPEKFEFSFTDGNSQYWSDVIPRPTAGVWHKLDIYMNRATPINKAYLDGVPQTLQIKEHDLVTYGNFTNNTMYFMSRATTSLFAAGSLDEVHLSVGERSADWVTAEFNNQSSPSTFLSLGAETCNTGSPTPTPIPTVTPTPTPSPTGTPAPQPTPVQRRHGRKATRHQGI